MANVGISDEEKSYPDLVTSLLGNGPPPKQFEFENINQEVLIHYLQQQGMLELYAFALQKSECPWLTDLRDDLRKPLHQSTANELLHRKEVSRVLDALAQQNIQTVLLKGAALAYLYYTEPYLRPHVDTDIFIHQKDIDQVKDIFADLSYKEPNVISGEVVSHQFMMQRADEFGRRYTFDIHWKITNPQAFAKVLTLEEMLEQAKPISALGANTHGPSVTHALIHACVHRIAHFAPSNRLIWLYDIHLLAKLLKEEEWKNFCKTVKAKHVASVCLHGILAAKEKFSTGITDERLQTLENSIDHKKESYARVFLQGEISPAARFFSDLSKLNWMNKFRLIKEHLFPPTEYIRRQFQPTHDLLIPYYYLARIGNGAWRTLSKRGKQS